MFNKVDFPLPDSPTIETRSPSFMSREISSTAFTGGGPSYIFEILFNDITVFVFCFHLGTTTSCPSLMFPIISTKPSVNTPISTPTYAVSTPDSPVKTSLSESPL